MGLDHLPATILAEILSRLGDSTDLARCRLTCRTLRSVSYDVRSIRLLCTRDRFLRSRDPSTHDLLPAFKSLVANLASLLSASPGPLSLSLSLSLSLATEESDSAPTDEVDNGDDLYLTDGPFLAIWLPVLSARLVSLSIEDYWLQSCWRPSQALHHIPNLCLNLHSLEVRNAWLSVKELNPMPKLSSLSLDFIRLDDENLEKVNECFPSLQVLNLTRVGGLQDPKIHLLQLRVFSWTASNFVQSITVNAPKLVELNLTCVEPKSLHLVAPLLLKLDLTIKKAGSVIKVDKFHNLRFLRLESLDLCNLADVFAVSRTIKQLELEAYGNSQTLNLEEQDAFDILCMFPEINELVLGPRAWFMLPQDLKLEGELKCLKKLVVHVPSHEFDATIIYRKLCPFLTHVHAFQVLMFIPATASIDARACVISKCISDFPDISYIGKLFMVNRHTDERQIRRQAEVILSCQKNQEGDFSLRCLDEHMTQPFDSWTLA